MNEDKVIKFNEKLTFSHPFDIFLFNISRAFHSETLQRRFGTIAFPLFVDAALGKQSAFVVFIGIHAVILMITNEIVDIITAALQTHDIIDYTFSIRTTVNVVAKKI